MIVKMVLIGDIEVKKDDRGAVHVEIPDRNLSVGIKLTSEQARELSKVLKEVAE